MMAAIVIGILSIFNLLLVRNVDFKSKKVAKSEI